MKTTKFALAMLALFSTVTSSQAKSFMYLCQPQTISTSFNQNGEKQVNTANKDIAYFIGDKFAVKCNTSKENDCKKFPLITKLDNLHLIYLSDEGVMLHTHLIGLGLDGYIGEFAVAGNVPIEQKISSVCNEIDPSILNK